MAVALVAVAVLAVAAVVLVMSVLLLSLLLMVLMSAVLFSVPLRCAEPRGLTATSLNSVVTYVRCRASSASESSGVLGASVSGGERGADVYG